MDVLKLKIAPMIRTSVLTHVALQMQTTYLLNGVYTCIASKFSRKTSIGCRTYDQLSLPFLQGR